MTPNSVRADAPKRESFACNGACMRAVSRALLDMALGVDEEAARYTESDTCPGALP